MFATPRLMLAAVACVAAAFGPGCSEKKDHCYYLPPTLTTVSAQVDASVVGTSIEPLWGDHYDLSYQHMGYALEAGFTDIVADLEPRSWRCSVGRWEIGFPPPLYGDSTSASELAVCIREFYRGPNSLAGADNPANYDFTYLDAQLAALNAAGVEPFLCFDYMPFTLASEQDPLNANNLGLYIDAKYSFSNGVRTSPPADNEVYARVVRNTIRHVRGLFAGAADYGVTYFEIGNEPDLCDAAGTPANIFWTGTSTQFSQMYAAIAAEVDADALLTGIIKLGGGSFGLLAWEPNPPFAARFAANVDASGARFDFMSYHSYSDDVDYHVVSMVKVTTILDAFGLNAEVVNGEWGFALDGNDPVYDQIEHGLFRAKVLFLMQLFGVKIAHESLFRDPGAGSGMLGLVRTGPAAHKPASDVYRALNLLKDTPQSLQVTVDSGHYMLAGKSADDTKVVVAYVGDDPGAGNATEIELSITQLPWGAMAFDANRYEVSEATHAAGDGVKLVEAQSLSGASYSSTVQFGPGPGGGRVIIWELLKQ